MNKSFLINQISIEKEISKSQADKVIASIIYSIIRRLRNGERVSVHSLGTFSVNKRAARNGRNPHTKEIIHIRESKVPVFKRPNILKTRLLKVNSRKQQNIHHQHCFRTFFCFFTLLLNKEKKSPQKKEGATTPSQISRRLY